MSKRSAGRGPDDITLIQALEDHTSMDYYCTMGLVSSGCSFALIKLPETML